MRVSTKGLVDLPIEYRWTARELVHVLWNDGVEHTDAVRAPFTAEDPTEGWDDIRINIDRSPVLFKMLGSDRSWVAFAVVDEFIVTIHSQNVAPDEVGLNRLDDLTSYLDANAFPWRDWPER